MQLWTPHFGQIRRNYLQIPFGNGFFLHTELQVLHFPGEGKGQRAIRNTQLSTLCLSSHSTSAFSLLIKFYGLMQPSIERTLSTNGKAAQKLMISFCVLRPLIQCQKIISRPPESKSERRGTQTTFGYKQLSRNGAARPMEQDSYKQLSTHKHDLLARYILSDTQLLFSDTGS